MSETAAAAVCSFAPVADPAARVLILGSMPGVASLRAQRYYAHPQNQFWTLLGELIGAGPALAYEERLRRLHAAGIALWDVFASCHRPGSLDSRIEQATAVPNDFAGFFARHRAVTHVFFNGATAEEAFRRRVSSRLALPALRYRRLPSTSPANASVCYARKLEAWREILAALRAAC